MAAALGVGAFLATTFLVAAALGVTTFLVIDALAILEKCGWLMGGMFFLFVLICFDLLLFEFDRSCAHL